MIKYILFFVTFLPFAIVAQDNAANKIGHSEVVEVSGANAKTLTDRANTFLSSKRVEAKTMGNVISGIGTLVVSYPSIKFGTDNGHVKFNIKIMVKDGKYKVDLTDFKHVGIQGKSSGGSVDLEKPECGETQISMGAWHKIKEQTQEQLKKFVQELKTKMDNPAKTAAPSSDF